MAENLLIFASHLAATLLCILMAAQLRSGSDVGVESKKEILAEDSRSDPFRRSVELANSEKIVAESIILTANSTLLSLNRTFELGFFTTDGESNWYLGVWYASIPIRTYVWVANRENPVRGNRTSASVKVTADGRLKITDSGGIAVWGTENEERGTSARLLETGNLILVSEKGKTVWQSFDFPTDTWLPEMSVTREQKITCWRSPSDPSPGNYSLRLKPPDYGEFELVYGDGVSYQSYWSTGNWTGQSFAAVPEMTVPYIYTFRFLDPYKPTADFSYAESVENGRLLTRFAVDSTGVLKQYVWFPQSENWKMFWVRPESACHVYNLCGNFGFCGATRNLSPCECLPGFTPADPLTWRAGDFSGGCIREDSGGCNAGDGFENIGSVTFNGAVSASFSGTSRSFCEGACLKNCSCIGLTHSQRNSACQNFYGRIFNLRNLTGDNAEDPEARIVYIRVAQRHYPSKRVWRKTVLVSCLVIFSVVLGFAVLGLAILIVRRKIGEKGMREEGVFTAMQLQVFSYKELYAATRGFSEKLGHGGFGAVFRGVLPGGTVIAAKRLERPGGAGEREFRAEVCTIGSVQHVNLVRLRGFCCERAHRLLVYDYMPNGPLSAHLGPMGRCLSWEARFRVAVGTARGIAYLHEECRDCIIHCDIKPENILLDADCWPKVSDFGLAKLLGRDFSRVVATMRGTWGYVAPEWISGVAITAKADVYSYGMTLLEIIGGRRNVEGGPDGGPAGERWFFPPWAAREIIEGRVEGVVDKRLGREYNRAEAERAGLVAVWCIQDDEGVRPTMGTVVKMLEGTVALGVPPPPQLLQALVAGESFAGPGVGSDSDPDPGPVSSEARSGGSEREPGIPQV